MSQYSTVKYSPTAVMVNDGLERNSMQTLAFAFRVLTAPEPASRKGSLIAILGTPRTGQSQL